MKSVYLVFLFSLIVRQYGASSIAICLFETRKSDVTSRVRQNRVEYIQRHDYEIFESTTSLDPNRAPHWSKVLLLISALEKYEWALWLDGDAVILNMSQPLEYFIDKYASASSTGGGLYHTKVNMLFSGDTNAINTGVLLLRKSKWTLHMLQEIWSIGLKLERHPQIGMGLDNAAFAIFLGGCSSTNSYEEFQRCYERLDIGYRDKQLKPLIEAAQEQVYRRMVPDNILKHIAPVPHDDWNSYSINSAKFIVHFAGFPVKEHLIKDALQRVSHK